MFTQAHKFERCCWEQKTCSKSTEKNRKTKVFVKLDISSVVYILVSGRRNYELNIKRFFLKQCPVGMMGLRVSMTIKFYKNLLTKRTTVILNIIFNVWKSRLTYKLDGNYHSLLKKDLQVFQS